MNRLEVHLKALKKQGVKGIIPYITAGDPCLDTTMKLLNVFKECGVPAVELGVPFSDPLADGVVNQRAAERALKSGTTLRGILERLENDKPEIPIILFTYYNPVFKIGLDQFAVLAKKAGISGILTLDLPVEEADEYVRIMKKNMIDVIFLIAPTSTQERIKRIVGLGSGFVYCVSRTGVTGVRSDVPGTVVPMVEKIRVETDMPIAVGFGISGPQQAKKVARSADFVVVGSAIVRLIEQGGSSLDICQRVEDFTKELVRAVK